VRPAIAAVPLAPVVLAAPAGAAPAGPLSAVTVVVATDAAT
jgi:hypothetical protein